MAGEDRRYTLTGSGIDRWLPPLLERLDGARAVDVVVAELAEADQGPARELIDQLVEERLLVPPMAPEAHAPRPVALCPEGRGPLVELLAPGATPEPAARPLRVLCQDRLDYEELSAFNRDARGGDAPWLWVSTGPVTRGMVSPLCLPEVGPCLGCLLGWSRRRSPMPALYDRLRAHVQGGGTVAPAPFPEAGLEVLAALVRAKAAALSSPAAPLGTYRLHVLELETWEVSAHPVPVDPDCPACAPR